ncbi:CZB domain-containing protein [Thiolinea disciformis]|uniref:CZB domain-containing protein n=1 Tax=Thiolinea disciformis TaxID=125614 RepID=UPI000370D705|nr:CZB domain-containing protein [Thiolinea disciformis]
MIQKHIFFLHRMNDHVQYLDKIKSTLAGKGSFKGTDCRCCALGKWIYSDGVAYAAQFNATARQLFNDMVEAHERFHEASARTLECQEIGDELGQYRALTEMYQLSNQLVQMLLRLDQMANQESLIA